jgi:hypothetical protein
MRFSNFDQEQEAVANAEFASSEFELPNSEYQAEADEMQLAAELLGVSNEQELEQFFGSLLSRVSGAASGFLKSQAGQQITGLLKSAAKQALPKLGGAIGNHFGGSTGAQIGSTLATNAGQLLGLELEGLSNEDREFAVARQFVRFGNDAVQRAAQSGYSARDARAAYLDAARQYAPGYATPDRFGSGSGTGSSSSLPNPLAHFATRGRWMRRGRTLILT